MRTKIFNRGTDAKSPSAAVAGATPALVPPVAAPVAAPAPPPEPAPAPGPDLAGLLDANVKEMSEKIARLASNLENAQSEKSGFEAKIQQMEDRMRKLSSLTEMISAQYNPFVGDAPMEREPAPRPEVGLAPPPAAGMPDIPAPEASPISLSLATPDFAPEAPPFDAPAHAAQLAPPELPRGTRPVPAADVEPDIHLWRATPGFESSMLLLGWADMLLKSAGSRETLLDLVNYYHNIGWIGDPARDQLLAYADGLVVGAAGESRDWRASVDVHERSLLFVEKLRAVAERGSR